MKARTSQDKTNKKAVSAQEVSSPTSSKEASSPLQRLVDSSTRVQDGARYHAIANGEPPIQRNNTGLPDPLKSGVEQLSGQSLDDVKVHRNSSKPTQFNAHAYAQGSSIHLAPGQDRHLPHEAWHVAQQKQGRVKPTTEVGGAKVNDSSSLEKEADVMGRKAMQMKAVDPSSDLPSAVKSQTGVRPDSESPIQRTGGGGLRAVRAAREAGALPNLHQGNGSVVAPDRGTPDVSGGGAVMYPHHRPNPWDKTSLASAPPLGNGSVVAPDRDSSSRPSSAESTRAQAGPDVGAAGEVASPEVLSQELAMIQMDFNMTERLYTPQQEVNMDIAELDRLRITNYLERLFIMQGTPELEGVPALMAQGSRILNRINTLPIRRDKTEKLDDKYLWLRVLSEVLNKPEEAPGLLKKLKEKYEEMEEVKELKDDAQEQTGVSFPEKESKAKAKEEVGKLQPLGEELKSLAENIAKNIKEGVSGLIEKAIEIFEKIKGVVEGIVEWASNLPIISEIIPFLGSIKTLIMEGISLKGGYDRFKMFGQPATHGGLALSSPKMLETVNTNNNQQIKDRVLNIVGAVVKLIGDVLTATGVGSLPGLAIKGATGIGSLLASGYRFFRNKFSGDHEMAKSTLIDIVIEEIKGVPVEKIAPPTHGPGFQQGADSDEHVRMQMHYKLAAGMAEQLGIGLLTKLKLEHIQGKFELTDFTPDKIREIMEGQLDDMNFSVN